MNNPVNNTKKLPILVLIGGLFLVFLSVTTSNIFANDKEALQSDSSQAQPTKIDVQETDKRDTIQSNESGEVSEEVEEMACPGCGMGEVMSSYSCGIEGYSIQVIRPASLPDNSNGRIIVASKGFEKFHAAPVEVPVLGGFSSTPTLGYYIQSLGYQGGDSPYCDRQGYGLKNTNVYLIERTHGSNYDGQTNIMYDSNIDSYSREQLVTTFNQNVNNPNVDTIPINCQGCIGNVDPIDDDDGGFNPGTYTTADGEVHDLWDMIDDDGVINTDGGTPLPVAEMKAFRSDINNGIAIPEEQKEQILIVRETMTQKAQVKKQHYIETSLEKLNTSRKQLYEQTIQSVESFVNTQDDPTKVLMFKNRSEGVINQISRSSKAETQQGKLILSVLKKVSIILEDRFRKLTEAGSVTNEQLGNMLEEILGDTVDEPNEEF